MPYQVSQLVKDLGAPVSAISDEPLVGALDRMLQHGFSQLPVVKGAGHERQFYFVTHESILLALQNFGTRIGRSGLRVDDALVKVTKVYGAADDLFDLLVGMRDINAAVIVDDDRNLTHVVTTYDTSQYFRQWAEDIMHVRDIEHSIRRVINFSFRKPNGEIDEDARRSAIDEMTSSNRALRKRFCLAVSHYVANATAEMRSESVDLAFLEFVKDWKNGTDEQVGVAGGLADRTDFRASSMKEAEVVELMDASRNLRTRFEAALRSYLNRRVHDVTLDEAALGQAFKFIYDRSEHLREFGKLTLADYIQLFLQDRRWERCKDIIKLKKEEVEHMLCGVCATRNDLAHFRDGDLTAQNRLQLKLCAAWLSERERLICCSPDLT